MSSPNMSRRLFLRGKTITKTALVVRPPWATTEELFIINCNRCNNCIISCPEKIIVSGDGGYPTINFQHGECTFCGECVASCNTNALKNITPTSQTSINHDNAWCLDISIDKKCLSMNAVVCRTCGDNCAAQAINFQLKTGGKSEPKITLDNCNGCGACVSVCPVNAVLISNAAVSK